MRFLTAIVYSSYFPLSMKFYIVYCKYKLHCIVDCCCCLVYGEDLYGLLPAIQSISFIYEQNMLKMKMKQYMSAIIIYTI